MFPKEIAVLNNVTLNYSLLNKILELRLPLMPSILEFQELNRLLNQKRLLVPENLDSDKFNNKNPWK